MTKTIFCSWSAGEFHREDWQVIGLTWKASFPVLIPPFVSGRNLTDVQRRTGLFYLFPVHVYPYSLHDSCNKSHRPDTTFLLQAHAVLILTISSDTWYVHRKRVFHNFDN